MTTGQSGATPGERLAELGLELPAVAAPLAAYVPAVRSGSWVLTAGQLPSVDGELVATGAVGGEVSAQEAYDAARTATLNALAAVAAEIGSVDHVRRVVRVCVYVAAAPGFTALAQVANGASDLLGEVFGDAGTHVRSAVGAAQLPLDAPVEVELVVEA
ncbi:RidA family protein [Nocardioidaceae bacterium]|nr:RidA family protein [Nocardioidaceae bacterium]